MELVVYAVALLLLGSVTLFIKAALFDQRPQKLGLVLAVLAVPLYLVYYNDRWPFGELRMRDVVRPLDNFVGADSNFQSDLAPAVLVGAVLLVHMTVFQRVGVRRRLQRVHDPIANFFAGTAFATLIGGILVSTFSWGWVGAIIVGGTFALVYLGALALLGAIIEVGVELSELFLVWVKRKVFSIATWITRVSSWVSSLSGRLVSRSLIERIRADTMEQESIFLQEQEAQDKRLYEAYLRDRARKRRFALRRGQTLEPDDSDGTVPSEPSPLPAQDGDPATQDGAVDRSSAMPAQSQPTEQQA